MESIGVARNKIGSGFWWAIQPNCSTYLWDWVDTLVMFHAARNVQASFCVRGTAHYSSCGKDIRGNITGACLPRGLFNSVRKDADSAINDENPLACYVYELVRRYGPRGTTFNGEQSGTFWRQASPPLPYMPITLWECHGEPCDHAFAGGFRYDCRYWHWDRLTDSTYWYFLESHLHGTSYLDSCAARKESFKKLYCRYVAVLDSAVRLACMNPEVETVIPRTAAFCQGWYPHPESTRYYPLTMPQDEWLQGFKAAGVDALFELATGWLYADEAPRQFENIMASDQAALERCGLAARPLWYTEAAWARGGPNNTMILADPGKVMTVLAWMQAANARPRCPVEEADWLAFSFRYHSWAIFADSSPSQPLWPQAYAFRQWSDLVAGAGFECQLAPTTRPWDTSFVGSYQFTDSAGRRVWIGWKPPGFVGLYPETLAIPLRTNDADTFWAASVPNPGGGAMEAALDGWLTLEMDSIPVIVIEQGGLLRPDLRVDSVKAVPGPPSLVAVVLFRLASSSWEKDSTGNTPADSARLIQFYYGSDTVAQDSGFTPWFPFKSDTSWRFLFGEGKYRFYAEFKDGLENSSPRNGDAEDSIVVFVANSGFDQQFGNWQFSGGAGGFESGSGMALLAAAPEETAWVKQFIPEDSLAPLLTDTVKLSSDVLVQVPEADSDAVGVLRLRYYYTPENPQLNDTTWQEVGSVEFLGGVQALAGLAAVEAGLVLPSPDSGYQWRGGEVGARVWGAGTGTGLVWLDNLRLQACGPNPGYSWWQECDSLALWDLEAGSGWRSLCVAFQDSAGVESFVPLTDSIVLDMDGPVTHITSPARGTHVNGVVSVLGWGFDPIIIPGDTFFESRRMHFRPCNPSEWLPCCPGSVSFSPVWPVDAGPFGPAAALGDWETDSLEDGTYWLRLTARDSAGNENTAATWFVVDHSDAAGSIGSGPEGGGSSLGSGSVWVGSSTGVLLHLSEDLDSLEAFSVADSNRAASVAGILKLASDTLLIADLRNRIAGREQRTLVNREQKPGYHMVFWDRADNKGRTCSQGIYVCRMEAEGFQAQRKVVLVR
uniref:Uncharacterized protein n=1 Tax=candidate division WOR-3 bacterium TaxID=2052148 RepID=A0A7C4GB04_UNCW3